MGARIPTFDRLKNIFYFLAKTYFKNRKKT